MTYLGAAGPQVAMAWQRLAERRDLARQRRDALL